MKFRTRSEQPPSVELTPLIDVVFLLLIFFMVSTTFISRAGLQVQVPEAGSTQPNPEQGRIEVMVTPDGDYLVDGEEIPPGEELFEVLRKRVAGSDRQRLLVIRADREARHAHVVAAMDAGKELGLTRIAIATRGEDGTSSP